MRGSVPSLFGVVHTQQQRHILQRAQVKRDRLEVREATPMGALGGEGAHNARQVLAQRLGILVQEVAARPRLLRPGPAVVSVASPDS